MLWRSEKASNVKLGENNGWMMTIVQGTSDIAGCNLTNYLSVEIKYSYTFLQDPKEVNTREAFTF